MGTDPLAPGGARGDCPHCTMSALDLWGGIR